MKLSIIQLVVLSMTFFVSFTVGARTYAGGHSSASVTSSSTGVSVRRSDHGSHSSRGHFGSGYRHAYGSRYGYGHSSSYRYQRHYFGRRSYGPRDYEYRPDAYYGYYPGLVWGVLSIPARIIDGLFGYPYYYAHPQRHAVRQYDVRYGNEAFEPSAQAYQGDGPMGTTGPGWVLLANGQYGQAQDIFSRDAHFRPSDGVAKIGLSLSVAAGGDLERGTWAMRRAARIDPESLVYVALERPLRLQVDKLVKRYRQKLERAPRDPDTAFMVASLSYLLGKDSAAQHAIDDAIRYGDDSPSAENLELLIRDRQAGGEAPASSTIPERG